MPEMRQQSQNENILILEMNLIKFYLSKLEPGYKNSLGWDLIFNSFYSVRDFTVAKTLITTSRSTETLNLACKYYNYYD